MTSLSTVDFVFRAGIWLLTPGTTYALPEVTVELKATITEGGKVSDHEHDDYFGKDRGTYGLVAVKRSWVPEWLWRIVAHWSRWDPIGMRVAELLCEEVEP